MDAARRLEWLKIGSRFTFDIDRQTKEVFFPQPYTQLAKVLSEMGHDRDARKVLMARETALAVEARKSGLLKADGTARLLMEHPLKDGAALLSLIWDAALRWVAGYGYAPQRAFYWMLGFIAVYSIAYHYLWTAGLIVPNSDVILTSPDWLLAMKLSPDHPGAYWTKLAPGIHYETFYSLAYATDVFIPLVDLGQESAWSETTVTNWGIAGRWLTFALELAGWFITALGAAAVTGIIQKDRG